MVNSQSFVDATAVGAVRAAYS